MKKLNKIKATTALVVVPLISLFVYPTASFAAPVIHQGTTSSYAVLASSGITVTTSASITGTAGSDIGSSPTAPVIAPMPSPVGVYHQNDASAIAARVALGTAISDVNSPTPTTIPTDLVSQVLAPGTYTSAATTFGNSGTVTFDAQGDPNAIFLMQAPGGITTSTSSSMVLAGQAQACNIFWTTGSSATLGNTSTFYGHLYAVASITANSGTTVHGNLLAQNGAVTLNTTTIVNDNCAAAPAVAAIPTPVQRSSITSVAPANCVTTGTTAITLNGNFLTPVNAITVNGINVAVGNWTQTATTLTVNTSVRGTTPAVIQVYNGQAPVLAAQSFTCTPVAVVTPTPTPTPVVTPAPTGTIHVIKMVVNGFGGTATAADFSLSLRHHGVDVLGSPDVGMASPGRAYVLSPGTYVLGEAASATFPNYISSFSIVGQATDVINLLPGGDLTVIETNTQLPQFTVIANPVVVKTVNGGVLPKTGSPWYNMLLVSTGLVLLGGTVALVGRTARTK